MAPKSFSGLGNLLSKPLYFKLLITRVFNLAMTFEHRRIALRVQYWGTHFSGFQRQLKQCTVQGALEQALERICGHPVITYGAGRTDTGVHASGQVVHFDTNSPIPIEKWPLIINKKLPTTLIVQQACCVVPPWHARFSATWREYIYTIYNSQLPDLAWHERSWFYYKAPLDETLMAQALGSLLGNHDLFALQLAGSSRPHSKVQIQQVGCHREGAIVYIRVRALSFLYGMMRLLTALVVAVGAGEISVTEFIRIWQMKDREKVHLLAPPGGLSLVDVGYAPKLFE